MLMFLKNKLQLEAHVLHPIHKLHYQAPLFLLRMKRLAPGMFVPHIKALTDPITSAKIVCRTKMRDPYLNVKVKFSPSSKNCVKKKIKPIRKVIFLVIIVFFFHKILKKILYQTILNKRLGTGGWYQPLPSKRLET